MSSLEIILVDSCTTKGAGSCDNLSFDNSEEADALGLHEEHILVLLREIKNRRRGP